MKKPTEGRHPSDQRSEASATQVAHFLRLSRQPRESYHIRRDSASPNRLSQFLRIERGREV